VNWLPKTLLLSFFLICLCACQSLDHNQTEIAGATQYFKSSAVESFNNEQYQQAQTMAEAWVALDPSQEAKTFLDVIEQRRQTLFDKALACRNKTKDIIHRHNCLKSQLKYRPGYTPAIDELRVGITAAEMALLETAHNLLEKEYLRETTAKVAVKQTPDKLDNSVNSNPLQDEIDRSLVEANIEKIHRLIAKDQWLAAGDLLLVIKNEWDWKQWDLMPLRQLVAENLYLEGQKLFRDSVEKAIGIWELAVAVDETHNLARLKLIRAYKIQTNLDSIN
jgi:hypothetical protein